MTETISDLIQNISRDIHKAYAVSIKGTSSLVVPLLFFFHILGSFENFYNASLEALF